MAATLGDFETFGNRVFRFESGTGGLAWRPWSPWGDQYVDSSLAAAKLQVPVDGTLDEKVIELIDTTGGTIHIFIQKIAGYGVDFDDSFDQVLNTADTFITADTIAGVLATIDISSLSGMTSTSAQVEASIVDAAAHAVVLAGISAAALSDAVTNEHVQNTDSGTIQTSFKVADGTAGKETTLDSSNITATTVIDLDRVDGNLNGATNAMPILTKTKATALTTANVLGQTVFISDIDVTGFALTYDGTDFISGVYFFQDASNTIATAPSVGDIFSHLGSFWECIDATTDQEVFVITNQKATFNKAATGNIEEDEAKQGIITNTGATGAIVLTFTGAAEVDGSSVLIIKTSTNQMTIENSGAGSVIANTTTETDVQIELTWVDGAWIVGPSTGTWA